MYLSKNTILVACLMFTPALISSTDDANKKDSNVKTVQKAVSEAEKKVTEAQVKAVSVKSELAKIKTTVELANNDMKNFKAELDGAAKKLEEAKR